MFDNGHIKNIEVKKDCIVITEVYHRLPYSSKPFTKKYKQTIVSKKDPLYKKIKRILHLYV